MKYIENLKDRDRVSCVYLCKNRQSFMTKNGKPYESVVLQDKTGVIDGKIWEPNSEGINEFDKLDYIEVFGDVVSFQGALQLNIKRIRKADEGEYDPADYLPVSERSIDEMYSELLGYISSVKNPNLNKLLSTFFKEDEKFIKQFKNHSAAKSVHHSFVGGLLEHTLNVTKLCDFYSSTYPIINRDLLITAAIFHDVGKTVELSLFPENDYTDDGQLLGHIVIGVEMIGEAIRKIDDFPVKLSTELKHCILAHHGEFEYGSPKKPALVEAVALNFADNTDAKMETMKEAFSTVPAGNTEWLGYNKFFESNIRQTSE